MLSLTLNPNRKQATFNAKYSGLPNPTIFWRDIEGNRIPWSIRENKSTKYEARQYEKKSSTILKIRNPKTTDSGFYTLCADNGQIQKEQKFKLLVKGIFLTVLFIQIQIYKCILFFILVTLYRQDFRQQRWKAFG